MALKISKTKAAIPIEVLVAEIDRQRIAFETKTGRSFTVPRNSGLRRTESKKALLKAIEDAGGKW